MNVNPLPASNITQPAGAVAVVEPPKPSASKPSPVAPAKTTPAEAKKPEVAPSPTKPAETKAGDKITDVKATGEKTEEGEPTFTLKVNGKDIVATQSQIIAMAQKANGAEAAMKRASEIEKLTADLLDNFDKDTFGLLVKRHGKEKAKEIAVQMVRNLISEEEKTPEQVELEELRAGKKRQEELEATAKKQKEDDEHRQKQRTLYTQILKDIDTELNNTHLPKDKLTLTRVLNYLAAGKKANGTVWTVKEAVGAVEIEDMAHATHYATRYLEGKLPSDKFREIFGEEALKKLNKEQINLLKNADKIVKKDASGLETSASPAVTPRKKTLSRGQGSEGISEREYRRQHGSLGGI
jgi:hypothetical protein